MADEKEETGENKEETVNKESKEGYKESTESTKTGIDKMKLAGVGLAVLGLVIFAAIAMFYPSFGDLFVKGIVFMVAIGAIFLVLLGILLGIYA